MSAEELIRVKIANATLQVPVYIDKATTLQIAEEISKRFKDIEEESVRIDTQAFALHAAFTYAIEKHALEQQQDDDNRTMVKALDKITTRLDDLTDRFTLNDSDQ